MLLTRLASFFTCCTGKNSCQTLGKSRASEPPQKADDEDRELGQTTATSSRPPGEKVGCCPCTRQATVAPGTPRMFWVGSRDGSEDTDTSAGSSMGQVLPTGRGNSLQEQDYKNLKTVAHKQTVVTEEDIRKTAFELLQNSSQSKPHSKTSPKLNDEDILTGIPTIDEKNLRPACKEPGRPTILGRGQSGVVRLMRLRRPERGSKLVAVKRLMLGTCSGPHPAMIKEIRALQAVENCSIFPKLVGVITKQTFAQEFVGNPKSMVTLSIFKALRGKPPISVEHWVLIIHDVITGISALHQSGWAHCDIQSNNVLLWKDRSQSDPTEARWQGRIIDLGNAKRLTGPDRYCLDLTLSEKAAYYRDCRHIPAEIVEGLEPYGVRSDIYSLGVLMQDIARQIPGMFELIPLADTCTVANPDERPTLRTLLKELNVWCQDHTGFRFSPVEKKWNVAYV
ncbi:serine/threonine-protein kinase pakC-like isoform X1 [Patiria miniata]|uniref:Protein kinase domain-containing protein n=1 Tax=Patiria miniata TaxID=46514 RepID=A0A914ATJ9_PATMI|nr:serine/threonine-protein kinase pakC-like isoform X1 [Patiria miniata]